VWRTAGADRVGTAIENSMNEWAPQEAGAVVLAQSMSFPDALAGTPLAVAKSAPLLLTPSTGLDSRVATEIQRLLEPGGVVYVLGGTSALSGTIDTQLTDLGYVPVRFAGASRYETAVKIAHEGLGDPTTIFETTGTNFPDALSAGVAAGFLDGAVLLTAGNAMPDALTTYLGTLTGTTRYPIGRPAAGA